MSLEKRIQALESRKVTTTRRDGTGNCICFPEGPCTGLVSQEDFAVAAAVQCPEHGNRLVGATQGGLYSPSWHRETQWISGWPYANPQTRKALFATYPGWPERPERYTHAMGGMKFGDHTNER
jgi:hypothetical protein